MKRISETSAASAADVGSQITTTITTGVAVYQKDLLIPKPERDKDLKNCISGREEPCRRYAEKAVKQNNENIRKDCGFCGQRWQSSFDNHFQWCLEQPQSARDSETKAREKLLNKCKDVSSAGKRTFYEPCYNGYRLDNCLNFGTSCERPAADKFCEEKGFTKATSWKLEKARPTYIIVDRSLCDDDFCAGFEYITCSGYKYPANKNLVCTIKRPKSGIIIQPGKSMSFSAEASDPDRDKLNYAWIFEGGRPDKWTSRFIWGVTWDTPGIYTATLTVTDGKGGTCTDTVAITVQKGGSGGTQFPKDFSKTLERLLGKWSYQHKIITIELVGDRLLIDLSAFGEPSVKITIIDDAAIRLTFPGHRASVGRLIGTDRIKWPNGSMWLKEPVQPVKPICRIDRPRSGTTVQTGENVAFSADASGPDRDKLNYAWIFEGGRPDKWESWQGSATAQWDTTGTYTATLTVTDDKGGTCTDTVAITVQDQSGTLDCDQDADKSVRQNEENLSKKCGFTGDLWHSNKSGHTHWCQNADQSRVAQNIAIREKALNGCKGPSTVTDLVCDITTPSGIAFTDEGKPLDFAGSAQGSSGDSLSYNWKFGEYGAEPGTSMKQNPGKVVFKWGGSYKVALTVTDARGKTCQATRHVLVYDSNDPREFCEGYAGISIEQDEENKRNNCGYSGKHWHDNGLKHRKWCESVSLDQARSGLRDRDEKLRECIGKTMIKPPPQPPPPQPDVKSTFTWDFETGRTNGWTKTGTAFNHQPTYGDNPTARRRGQPSKHVGNYWIGTYEKYQGSGSQTPGSVQGDGPIGTLTSNVFTIPTGSLSFLVGGGSSFQTRVELLVSGNRVLSVSGRNTETMHRVKWDLDPWAGQQGQIRLVDNASGGWGHINADDFRFSHSSSSGGTPGGIRIESATYGGNCGVAKGNVTAHIARQCNGKSRCRYTVNHKIIGDPAHGCAKTYTVRYRCGNNPQVFERSLPAEAGWGDKAVLLECTGDPGPSPRPDTDWQPGTPHINFGRIDKNGTFTLTTRHPWPAASGGLAYVALMIEDKEKTKFFYAVYNTVNTRGGHVPNDHFGIYVSGRKHLYRQDCIDAGRNGSVRLTKTRYSSLVPGTGTVCNPQDCTITWKARFHNFPSGRKTVSIRQVYMDESGGWQQIGAFDVPPGSIGKEISASFTIPPRSGSYAWEQTKLLTIPGSGAVVFDAKATNDIHVCFAETASDRSPLYEVVIGGWNNTQTVIRKGRQTPRNGHARVNVKQNPQAVVAANLWATYWVSVNRGLVMVGRGKSVGQNIMLMWQDPEPLQNLKTIAFSTWNTPVEYRDIHLRPAVERPDNAGTRLGEPHRGKTIQPPDVKSTAIKEPPKPKPEPKPKPKPKPKLKPKPKPKPVSQDAFQSIGREGTFDSGQQGGPSERQRKPPNGHSTKYGF